MVEIFDIEALVDREDLLPVFQGSDEDPIGFVPANDEKYTGDFATYLKIVRRSNDIPVIFRKCLTTSGRVNKPQYARIEDFPETNVSWGSSLHVAKLRTKRETQHQLRDGNLPFLRRYMMGDENTPIRCPFTDQRIDSWEMVEGQPINIWEQHHFMVKNRASVQKESSDPGEILKRMDFHKVEGRTVDGVKDMMRTVFLSPTAHKAVHNTWTDSDIMNYSSSQLPHALQNEEQWSAWLEWLSEKGYEISWFGNHSDWINSLKFDD